jgi:methylmalonyl-CoA mutase
VLKNYYPLGIVVPPTSPVQEISQSLEQTTLLMDVLTDNGLKKDLVFRSISLSFSCEENFFATIAKLKAIRILWYQLSQAFEIASYSPGDLHLHVTSQKWIDEKFQPHGNMIKNTAHAIAAVLGGCNALTIRAEDDNSEMMKRVGLHVTNLLKQESHLDDVSDPVAGAYALDRMVHEFAQAGWSDFQHRMHSHEA